MRASVGKMWGMGCRASPTPGAPPSPHPDVGTNTELSRPRASGTFTEGSACRRDPSLAHPPALSRPRGWGMGPKVPSFQSWLVLSGDQPRPSGEPTKHHLIRTKDTPVNQEIPKDSGAVCKTLLLAHHSGNNRASGALRQELGSKTKY